MRIEMLVIDVASLVRRPEHGSTSSSDGVDPFFGFHLYRNLLNTSAMHAARNCAGEVDVLLVSLNLHVFFSDSFIISIINSLRLNTYETLFFVVPKPLDQGQLYIWIDCSGQLCILNFELGFYSCSVYLEFKLGQPSVAPQNN